MDSRSTRGSFEAIEYGHFGWPSQPLGRARIREKFLECTQVYGERVLAERLAAAYLAWQPRQRSQT
jgi:hypothetical protein